MPLRNSIKQWLPILLPLLLLVSFFLHKQWEVIVAEWKLDRALQQNKELKAAISNLTASETVAFADVIKRAEKAGGAEVELVFSETERGNPNKVIREEKVTALGELTYFDALVVSFDDESVGSGEKKSLYLWKRIFGEMEAPEDGHRLDQSLPKAYEEISLACEGTFFGFKVADNAEYFWKDIWSLANEPGKLKHLGIHSVQGKASSIKLREGKRYKLTIGNTGKIDLTLEGPSPLMKGNPGKDAVN